jgi:aryl-alcohol dehydrogenase-like predicted oxidoreductase
MMQKERLLGRSGIEVSRIGAGTNRWKWGKNDESVHRAFRTLVGAGVNFFDTAEVYTLGGSERLLGACLQQVHLPLVIASKFAPLPTRLSHSQFLKALDASLSRLGVPTIDLYYVHFPFTLLSVERLMDWMALAVEAGKVRAVGVSNFGAGRMRRAAARLEVHGVRLAANQVRYSVWHRQPEEDGVLAACRELGVALVAYRPLEGGLLGSGAAGALRKGGAMSGRDVLMEVLRGVAERRRKSVSQVALSWLVQRDEHVIPIPGVTGEGHALENADTLDWDLTDDEFNAIYQASFRNRW